MSRSDLITSEMAATVRSSLDGFRAKAFDELAALPVYAVVQSEEEGMPFGLDVHRDTNENGDVLVAVRATRARLFGIFTQTEVKGFVARPNGERVEAREELLWPYI